MNLENEVSIVLGGAAGQGIHIIEESLTKVLKLSGYNVFATKEYMSRVRGGINTTEIVVSSKKNRSYFKKVDLLVTFEKGVLNHLNDRLDEKTIILGEIKNIDDEYVNNKNIIDVPITEISKSVGGELFSNTVGSGIILGLFDGDLEIFNKYITEKFSKKGAGVIDSNLKAALKGYTLGKKILIDHDIQITIKKNSEVKNEVLLSGTEAFALGFARSGCNFVSFYPMTPSTGVSVFLANHAKDLGIIVEQVEDEISAINMAIGSWYAGGRGLVTTSGGGFSLMCEAVSLSGMTESPVVIYLGQRPGPSTGLPTRTAQGDLNLALYSGQGEFPRIIYAPGSIEEAYFTSQLAFNMADKYQVPVFVLSDQYLSDTYYNISDLELKHIKKENYITKTEKDYKRYRLSDSPISKRGIPGYGDGIVLLCGNEHDEFGDVTEDPKLITKMAEKRNNKINLIEKDSIMPKFFGSDNYKNLIVTWGSTYYPVRDALLKLDLKDTALLHFNQVYPLPKESEKYFKNAEKIINVELNYSGQFGQLLKQFFGINIHSNVLKYDGRTFSVEDLSKKLEEILRG
ncbi:pyruvate flavodoxin/ferredoxin oxidoreductase domain protein [Methanococcus vannielii SB]|jgi:2-oxoglutarate ferredoxin oxidoreductase subunit alpha|uniref:2-oxoglutarate synthase subunit KorA n=1 Tax=Methanococcus vannielii (strain ATCC 35089 / DSM 1224 / JCM 13029 / OCM 148 / SB) TaxID=406327 RepID=A6URU2_METVS|nr:2-oxoacid:acceptor oxidoreductase subunit alpha [Methanococcus vannielii]ABR55214.1 pyruvate flavodoxin/ferredoxin oxidoreductase domain protein [Methanococcus vannielii SB]